MPRWFAAAACVSALVVSAAARVPQANEVDAALFQSLTWRNIGPFRGGRTKAVSGVPGQPNVFYIGAVNGGVWTTNDYGRTWRPIFDDQPTASIGAIAVASSDPNVIYVGSGEGMQRPDLSTGDGIYKSTDAGRTWTHLGLRDGQQIPEIVVDPGNPNRLFVAVLGHPYGPNTERGIFRSADGGRTFERVLYKDENTGGVDVTLDPSDPQTVYAVLWESRQGPWENAVWKGPGSGLFKSTDGGTTWRPLTRGLPTFAEGLGRIGITVAPSLRTRLFAVVDAGRNGGIFRSDDAGETWARVNDDPRLVARPNDASDIRVHPANPDIVYVPTIVAWRSTDGGKTFTAFRGAPGGDDYQKIWINPGNPNVMILTADQGAVVTVNGGDTWSSWYNQPTAQFYHVSTDNAFPYRVCGGQQESGSACVASRGEWGQITVRDWSTVGVEEYGYVAPDPLDPDVVYGGKITRFDRRTGQVQTITPRKQGLRALRTAPVLFSPTDPRTLFFAANTIWKTTNGGQAWTEISPELSRTTWEIPPSVGVYRTAPTAQPARRGVVYTIAPSAIDAQVMWAGTDDGLIYLTRNGGNQWNDVTPKALVPWAKVSLIEASHFDSNIAYAAVNSLRLDDLRPHIYRTKDAGATWTEITRGLPATGPINAIREDGQRRGLLFAAGELGVSVSFDDGESWQSLRLNMPATSVRDVVVKDADLVAGTHGRGFWILDDLSPLRQITADIARQPSYLFRPPTVWRYRWNKNTDTPLPPDEPAAPNPPDGVALSYLLSGPVTGPVTLDIVDPGTGETIRSYSSASPVEPPLPGRNIPDYWLQPPQRLRTTPGLHRFVWDLRYAPPPSEIRTYPIAAVAGNTLPEPRGLFVLPGTYQARLNVDGRSYRQPIVVRMDPRVKTPAADLTQQFNLSKEVDAMWRRLRTARETLMTRTAGASGDSAAELQKQLHAVTDALQPLQDLFESLQEADVKPSASLEAAVKEALSRAAAVLAAMTPTT
jgi:photosystem II stability/assembly factor-like uncharacterized protein